MAHRIADKTAALAPLRVLPRGTALVQDYRALHDTLTNRFIGWKWNDKLGQELLDASGKKTGKYGGGRAKQIDQVVEIAADDPYRTEYLRHLKDGDLWAADEATARAAGVQFEPDFMDEHPKTTAALAPKKSAAPTEVEEVAPTAPSEESV